MAWERTKLLLTRGSKGLLEWKKFQKIFHRMHLEVCCFFCGLFLVAVNSLSRFENLKHKKEK